MRREANSFVLCGCLALAAACGSSPGADGGVSDGSASGGGAGRAAGGGGMTGQLTGGMSGGDAGPSGSCTISNVTATISPKIATVGIVTWATDLKSVTSAAIEFGPTTAYGMTAPVDIKEKDLRTLLLGMKAAKLYHYRITATGDGGTCVSGDNTITTGPLVNGLPKLRVTTNNAAKLAGGFLLVGQLFGGFTGGVIYDVDGDPVWWFNIDNETSSAAMTFDGKGIWLSGLNCCVPTGPASVHLVSMDGMSDQDLSAQFPGQNHQLTVLPDESVAFYGYADGKCDDIKERKPDGTTRIIANTGIAQGVSDNDCHINTIQYSRYDDTLIFSDVNHNSYTKVKRTTGETVWVLNGKPNDFGAAPLWTDGNHGLDVLGMDHLLIFNNATPETGSKAIEWQLTTTPTKSAKKLWSYTATSKLSIVLLGDVQRLSNGNTMVGYSSAGELHEVAADGTLLQTLNWPIGGTFGYIEKRPSLYGHPPKLRIQ